MLGGAAKICARNIVSTLAIGLDSLPECRSAAGALDEAAAPSGGEEDQRDDAAHRPGPPPLTACGVRGRRVRRRDRAHEGRRCCFLRCDLVCRLLLEKKKNRKDNQRDV